MTSIDLLVWPGTSAASLTWNAGSIAILPRTYADAVAFISNWTQQSNAEYLLLWQSDQPSPRLDRIEDIIQTRVDIAHCGLKQGLGDALELLCYLGVSWDKFNAPAEIRSTSWKMDVGVCLIRRTIYLQSGGLDPIFDNPVAGGLEFGYRCLKLGAVIEHHPGLFTSPIEHGHSKVSSYDLYCFVLRHYNVRWAKYFFVRKLLQTVQWRNEWANWQRAKQAVEQRPSQWSYERSIWQEHPQSPIESLRNTKISVILPTLGRYDYVPKALDSLLRQTIPPAEVIVVDQNPAELRQPKAYEGYESLNLQVIWQDERGQSLARNTGLQVAHFPYILLFDDDSVADNDMIEKHLTAIIDGHMDVSTGVSYPPPPTDYVLPKSFQFPRLSQTFDTGNSLLPLALARKMGGLDRNYDFGPGTDADFGTRLYLAGYRIFHNPEARRMHYKAETGGLRVHGARKYNSDAGLLKPFPPVTQSYYALRYMNTVQRKETTWLYFVINKLGKEVRIDSLSIQSVLKIIQFGLFLLLFPLKVFRSRRQATKFLSKGILLADF